MYAQTIYSIENSTKKKDQERIICVIKITNNNRTHKAKIELNGEYNNTYNKLE